MQLRLIRYSASTKRFQGVFQHNPRADGRCKSLGIERAQGDRLPSLYIPSRPIVQEHEAKDGSFGLVYIDGLAELVALAQ